MTNIKSAGVWNLKIIHLLLNLISIIQKKRSCFKYSTGKFLILTHDAPWVFSPLFHTYHISPNNYATTRCNAHTNQIESHSWLFPFFTRIFFFHFFVQLVYNVYLIFQGNVMHHSPKISSTALVLIFYP